MKIVKRILGILLILLAPLTIGLMVWQMIEKVGLAAEGVAKTNTALQWGIILFIFIPICAGLAIFGKYSLQGEYDSLPETSEDL